MQATIDITVGVDKEGYGTFHYMANQVGGSYVYKTVTKNPNRGSAEMTIKAIAATQILRIDGWSITFYRPADFDAIVEVLLTAEFFTPHNYACTMSLRDTQPTHLSL